MHELNSCSHGAARRLSRSFEKLERPAEVGLPPYLGNPFPGFLLS